MNRKQTAMEYSKIIYSQGIEKIILYGSVAREEDNENSDIDILIVAKNKYDVEEKIYDTAYDYYIHDKENISVILLSNDDLEYKKNTNFINNVEKEGISII
ncbi:MAG: nucleotidyltransferase domain-containing protein [Methanobrevibacter sp.]|jgi:predicted nucleotidyltransferase|nr:nucleotidyltransferase domain-containing protein [Methanobrevibacter sp.]